MRLIVFSSRLLPEPVERVQLDSGLRIVHVDVVAFRSGREERNDGVGGEHLLVDQLPQPGLSVLGEIEEFRGETYI